MDNILVHTRTYQTDVFNVWRANTQKKGDEWKCAKSWLSCNWMLCPTSSGDRWLISWYVWLICWSGISSSCAVIYPSWLSIWLLNKFDAWHNHLIEKNWLFTIASCGNPQDKKWCAVWHRCGKLSKTSKWIFDSFTIGLMCVHNLS